MKRWIWYAYWSFALVFIALVLFAIPEFFAIKDNGVSFSLFMFTMGQAFPLWIFFWGLLIGGLAVHLLWHWIPPGAKSEG
jgi:hypothetical protein